MLLFLQNPGSPSVQLRFMRPAEPARVVEVEYFIANEEQTWMRLKLALADDSSALNGREFMVDLPPPQTAYGNFIILRSRWDAAMQRRWRVGDECQVTSLCRNLLSSIPSLTFWGRLPSGHPDDTVHSMDLVKGIGDETPAIQGHPLALLILSEYLQGYF